MPQLPRTHCSRCGESVYNCLIAGVRIPLVVQIVVGQPADTGPALDVNGAGVRVPSFVREILQTSLARLELCVACTAEVFGLALVTAAEDPCYDANLDGIPDATQIDPALSHAEQYRIMHARTLEAIRIGRGAPDAATPVPHPVPTPTDPATPPAADRPPAPNPSPDGDLP
jgi:hypothetical protein